MESLDIFKQFNMDLWHDVNGPDGGAVDQDPIASQFTTIDSNYLLTGQMNVDPNPPSPEENLTPTPFGGLPPPGWGAHPKEEGWWYEEPRYAHHPISEKLEVVGGLFHRMWPEHMEQLLQMKRDGWPHRDILEVVGEFWKRQEKNKGAKSATMDAAKDTREMHYHQELSNVMASKPSKQPTPAGQPGVYNKSQSIKKGKQIRVRQDNPGGGFLGIVLSGENVSKADTVGGELTLTQNEMRRKDKQIFARKPAGVGNAGFTPVEESDDTDLIDVSDDNMLDLDGSETT